MQGLRFSILVLFLTVALGTGMARANLIRLETMAARLSGHVLDHSHFRAVFHAPLGRFWILRPEGAHAASRFSEVLLTLWVEKVAGGLRVTMLDFFERQSVDTELPDGLGERLVRRLLKDYGTISADRHRLARFHDRLLGQPLAHDLALRGGTGNSLTVPAGSHPRVFVKADGWHGCINTPDGGQSPLLWKSYGDWVR